MRVAVLGAGIAGLTVAHALKREAARGGLPLDLEVFESGPRAGGRIRTTEADGFRVEWAADAFQTGPGPARSLVEELGLTEFLGAIDTVAGTPEEVKRILDGLAERGVSTFIANMPGHADKLGTLRRLSKLMGRT